MEAIGAVPTSMSASEVRQAMDSGVVKAVSFAPHAHMSFLTRLPVLAMITAKRCLDQLTRLSITTSPTTTARQWTLGALLWKSAASHK